MFPSLPPHSGSKTSAAAAAAIAPVVATIRTEIFTYLVSRGADGATADEVERAVGRPGNTVRPRLLELRRRGLIRLTDRTRPTMTGRAATVYVAV